MTFSCPVTAYLLDSLLHDLDQVLGVTHEAGLVFRLLLVVGRRQGVALLRVWGVLGLERLLSHGPGPEQWDW